MSRWLPFPLLSAAMLAMWLLLNESIGVGQILLGGVLAVCLPWTLVLLDPARARVRRPGAIVRLATHVLVDIIRSNVAVARIVLNPRHRAMTSGFVDIPLALRDPYGLATLACIITATPGTLWVALDSRRNLLTIHVLDLVDERTWIETIKRRYESLLLEIFEWQPQS